MTDRTPHPLDTMMAINPLIAFWSMPYLMTCEMMTAWLRTTSRGDTHQRNPDKGQIPVPPVLQDSKDKELFA